MTLCGSNWTNLNQLERTRALYVNINRFLPFLGLTYVDFIRFSFFSMDNTNEWTHTEQRVCKVVRYIESILWGFRVKYMFQMMNFQACIFSVEAFFSAVTKHLSEVFWRKSIRKRHRSSRKQFSSNLTFSITLIIVLWTRFHTFASHSWFVRQ